MSKLTTKQVLAKYEAIASNKVGRMKYTVTDSRGDGQATKGKTYKVVSIKPGEITIIVPSKKKGIPPEFVVDPASIEIRDSNE